MDPINDKSRFPEKEILWPSKVIELSIELHSHLAINDKNWHKFKSISNRRSAELLSGALVQLLQNGNPKDIEAMLDQATAWLKKELKDPGCPRH